MLWMLHLPSSCTSRLRMQQGYWQSLLPCLSQSCQAQIPAEVRLVCMMSTQCCMYVLSLNILTGW